MRSQLEKLKQRSKVQSLPDDLRETAERLINDKFALDSVKERLNEAFEQLTNDFLDSQAYALSPMFTTQTSDSGEALTFEAVKEAVDSIKDDNQFTYSFMPNLFISEHAPKDTVILKSRQTGKSHWQQMYMGVDFGYED